MTVLPADPRRSAAMLTNGRDRLVTVLPADPRRSAPRYAAMLTTEAGS